MVTDRGSNEVLAKKVWATIARDIPQVIVFPMDCLEHQSHLITLQGLKLADSLLKRHGAKFQYFSSLATVCNTLRDLAKQVFDSWCEIHGDRSGVKLVKRLWPKLIGGRWNSCHEVEERMCLVGGRAMAEPVIMDVLTKKKKNKQSEDRTRPGSGSVDELNFQSMQAHTEKMGMWRSNTAKFVQQSLWWVIAEAMNIARDPTVHLSVPGLVLFSCLDSFFQFPLKLTDSLG